MNTSTFPSFFTSRGNKVCYTLHLRIISMLTSMKHCPRAFTKEKTTVKTRLAGILLPIAMLLGCGSDPAPAKPKVAEPAPVKAPEPAPSPRVPELPPAPPVTTGPVPSSEKSPPPPPSTTTPAAPQPGTPATTRKVKPGPDEFDPEVVGGRPIGQWMEMLNSGKKDDMIEAMNALKFIPNKSKKAVPRIEELTKNPDKEVAQEATDALKTINGK
jgi:hypothetical protein